MKMMKHNLIVSLIVSATLCHLERVSGQEAKTEKKPSATASGFVLIPEGKFQMGDSFKEGNDDELPVHSVQVSAFYLAKHQTTKALWDEVRNWGRTHGYTDLAAGRAKGPTHPVVDVSWYDVVKWCNARSEKEGLTPCYRVDRNVFRTGGSENVTCNWYASGYRLPTEAEWEKAARGGRSGSRFPWGNTISHKNANYRAGEYRVYEGTDRKSEFDLPRPDYDVERADGHHPSYSKGDSPYTSPVGSFPANAFGLHDMIGNVWEWCWDRYSDDYYASSPASDPRGANSGFLRVIRGGSWGYHALLCRLAGRHCFHPADGLDFQGFRPARSSVP